MNKKISRLKRAIKTREKIKLVNLPRLSVHKTSQHIYAQLINPLTGNIIVTASTRERIFSAHMEIGSNKVAAEFIGKLIAERTIGTGIKKIAFDRSGFKYHGRIKALAESARTSGLEF